MFAQKRKPARKIQSIIFRTLISLIVIMTLFVTLVSIVINIRSGNQQIDLNLQNVASSIADFSDVQQLLVGETANEEQTLSNLNTLKDSLIDVDVISIVDRNGIRKYHTNNALVGTEYDGTFPDPGSDRGGSYVTSDTGPSGNQRRAYAAVYDEQGQYCGFVLAIMLNKNIYRIIFNSILTHLICAFVLILAAVFLSKQLSNRIKNSLLGYEPDTFGAMFIVRDNILESLEEGILAVDRNETIVYANEAVKKILHTQNELIGKNINECAAFLSMDTVLINQERYAGVSVKGKDNTDLLVDKIPVLENDEISGGLCILHDRSEYTKMLEDLTGVKYLVESMRANNHDFTNKLHVILGLLQMKRYDDAAEYISNISSIQQKLLHEIMTNIEDPQVAALIIGKYARAAELNIQFKLASGSSLKRNDINIPSGDLVTLLGNLIDNAMEAIEKKDSEPKEIVLGILTRQNVMMITVDDTGIGIASDEKDKIFTNGYSTKGENRGTGLSLVQNIVNKYNGTLSVETEIGEGTSFVISLKMEGDEYV